MSALLGFAVLLLIVIALFTLVPLLVAPFPLIAAYWLHRRQSTNNTTTTQAAAPTDAVQPTAGPVAGEHLPVVASTDAVSQAA
ncbi:hypothetical protein AAEX63_08720 [Luteococcus sp. H138]|uniref:hypothetical protein n=1 Tax=unclassified Luteococcus TaxID=2639923 RepID=UPI00313E61E8